MYKILLAILLLFTGIPGSFSSIQNGLQGWWKMDEVSGDAFDSSWNGNVGTATGTTVVTNCARNSCRKFNGSSDVLTVGRVGATVSTGSISISFWAFQPAAVNFAAIIGCINGDQGTGGQTFEIKNSGVNDGIIFIHNSYSLSAGALGLGKWNHFVGTFDGTNGNVYLNGVLVGGPTAETLATAAEANFTIGKLVDGGGTRWFTGNIDDVRLYNRALTAQEIKDLFNGTRINYAPGT